MGLCYPKITLQLLNKYIFSSMYKKFNDDVVLGSVVY